MSGLTVIIPALNAMPYLPEALASLQAQTFRDFEVILWDNGSTDGTVEEAKRWIPDRLPGRVVSDQPLPLHLCLARMVEEAETEYIARMDADDICLAERFAVQLQALKGDQELAVVGSRYREIDSSGAFLPEPAPFPATYAGLLGAFLTCNALLHPSVMFRRDAVLAAGNYGPCPPPCEDYDLWMRVAKTNRLANLPQVLLHYRVHERGIISAARQKGVLEEPNRACIQRHCQELFHLSPQLYARLRARRVFIAALALLPAAQAIARRAQVPLWRVLGSPSFLFSARCLTRRSDLLSRLLWGVCQRALAP
jgi:glycosyltransferase involved in cell wall biosynthesis